MRAIRRLLSSAPAEDAAATDELRQRVRRLRRRSHRLERENKELKARVKSMRDSVRDPFPLVELPESVLTCIDQVRAESLSYLGRADLAMLAKLVREADETGRKGLVIEAGTARGGSAIAMAAAKDPARPMKVYDVFGMIPPPSDRDGEDVHQRYEKIVAGESKGVGGETYYGYRDDLYTEVTESFARLGTPAEENGVELIRGLFEDTIELDEPVVLAHLDGDWYDSTMTCLERIAPLLVRGGRIVLDDYWAWSGCRQAVDDYFRDRPGFLLEQRARMHVVKL